MLICQLDLSIVLMIILLVQVMQYISLLLTYYVFVYTYTIARSVPNLSTSSQHASDDVCDLATGEYVITSS